MKPSNPPVKHHYTPQFLLKHWATQNGKLWRFTKPHGDKVAKKLVAPAEIGYKKHLYTTPGLPFGTTQQIEEKFMSPLDAAAAEAHSLLLTGKVDRMPQKQRSAWSRFIMSQWFRTPEGVKAFKKAMGLLLTKEDPELNAKYKKLKKDGFPDTLEAAMLQLNPDFAEQAALKIMCKMMDDPTNGLRLNNMHWSIRNIDGGHDLLVSDVLLQQSSGVFSPSGYITMPLTPRKLFVAVTNHTLADTLMSIERNELVGRANSAVVRRASEYVGASGLSQRAFIEANFGQDESNTLVKGLAKKYEEDTSQAILKKK
jgi:Protein of unknown function (DUF4238)